jgi:hypothetical protein
MKLHWLVFVLGAVLSWGAYGPALHKGRAAFPDPKTASMRALLCVGVAYFLVGVLVPLATLGSQGNLAGFNVQGSLYSTLAGGLGALGAVCIIWAFQHGGKAIGVMPLVFAGAPMVNAAITTATHARGPEAHGLHPLLFVGFGCAALGAWLVLRYMPS